MVCDTKERFVTATIPVRSRPLIATGALPAANVMADGANVSPTVSAAVDVHEIVALPLVGTTPSDQFVGSLKLPSLGPMYQPGSSEPTDFTTILVFPSPHSKTVSGAMGHITLASCSSLMVYSGPRLTIKISSPLLGAPTTRSPLSRTLFLSTFRLTTNVVPVATDVTPEYPTLHSSAITILLPPAKSIPPVPVNDVLILTAFPPQSITPPPAPTSTTIPDFMKSAFEAFA